MKHNRTVFKTFGLLAFMLLVLVSGCSGGIQNFSQIAAHPQIEESGADLPFRHGPPGGYSILDNNIKSGTFKGYYVIEQRQYRLPVASPEPSIENFYGQQLTGWKERIVEEQGQDGIVFSTYTWSKGDKALLITAYAYEGQTFMEVYFVKK